MMKRYITILILVLFSISQSWAADFIGQRSDFRDETIYFVITTRFYDGDPSNNTYCWDDKLDDANHDPAWRGDFSGLIQKLDYIKALGFTAIWITPVVENASGMDYHGYHAINFQRVDPRYESQDVTLQTLIDEVHHRDMRLILDIVMQHTGNFGEQFLCPEFDKRLPEGESMQAYSNLNKVMHPTEEFLSRYPDYLSAEKTQYARRLQEMKNTDGVNHDSHNYWHHFGNFNWDDITCQWAQIAGDCVDLNTENPAVIRYLTDCYARFIRMGIDGFRIDTGRHVSRLTFNQGFLPAFRQAFESEEARQARGRDDYYMFAEICTRDRNVIYRNTPPMSTPYYTWTADRDYMWNDDAEVWNTIVNNTGSEPLAGTNQQQCQQEYRDDLSETAWRTSHQSTNAKMQNGKWHQPDYSRSNGLGVIDFPMHWNFWTTSSAFGVRNDDVLYNDATWNVTYVDSHDYSPDDCQNYRYTGAQSMWASNLDLMYAWRGIPCLYYGSEIEFKKGCRIDNGTGTALKETGRAYYGGYLQGEVSPQGFAEYTQATGNVQVTLSHPLARHIQRLNQIHMAIPSLRKGQWTQDGVSGSGIAFKRAYQLPGHPDYSYALVLISEGSQASATYSAIPAGIYREVITGEEQSVPEGGKLAAQCHGAGNMRIWVLDGPGKVGQDGKYLYATTPAPAEALAYDGTEEDGDPVCQRDDEHIDLGDDNGGQGSQGQEGGDSEAMEYWFYYDNTAAWPAVYTYLWGTKDFMTWPGKPVTERTADGLFRYSFRSNTIPTGIIIHDGTGSRRAGGGDMVFHNGGLYTASGYTGTTLTDGIQAPSTGNASTTIYDLAGRKLSHAPAHGIYIIGGHKVVR